MAGVAAGLPATQAALDAGYGNGDNYQSAAVQASRALKKPKVQAALEAALPVDHVLRRLRYALDDDTERTRPSMVRAAEIALKVHGLLNTDVNVNIDARSVVLDGADSLSVADLEQLAQSLGDDTEDDT